MANFAFFSEICHEYFSKPLLLYNSSKVGLESFLACLLHFYFWPKTDYFAKAIAFAKWAIFYSHFSKTCHFSNIIGGFLVQNNSKVSLVAFHMVVIFNFGPKLTFLQRLCL